MPIELITGAIGFFLSLFVFSYLIGDNPLFRFALYLFVGASSGYAAVVICYEVLLPKLQALPLEDPIQLLIGIIPFFLGTTLLAKLTPRISWVGSPAAAILVGVGAATALAGALGGTLVPQVQFSMNIMDFRDSNGASAALFKLVEGSVMLAGTILTLIYFQFGARRREDGTVKRNFLIEIFAWMGQIFIAISLGSLFSGVYMAALTAMIDRLSVLIDFVKPFLGA